MTQKERAGFTGKGDIKEREGHGVNKRSLFGVSRGLICPQ